MISVLNRAGARFLSRHPWQLALAILGIALGVAVVISIDLAKSSALSAFDQATQTVSGKATHQITGGPDGLDERFYAQLRIEERLRSIAPRIEGFVKLNAPAKTTLHLLGIDLFAEPSMQTRWQPDFNAEIVDLAALLTKPNTVALAGETAERLGLGPGDEFSILVGQRRETVRLVGVLNGSGMAAAEDLMIADIATAQELLRLAGKITRIDLIIKDGRQSAQILSRLRSILPKGAQLNPAGSESSSVRTMTRAFYTNLTALSFLSLLVGMFLIYNTMTFMVVQRRQLFGSLRAIGVTRRQIFRLILTEALALGALGTLIGIPLGITLGNAMLSLITRTLDNVYFSLSSAELAVSPIVFGGGCVLGVGATLLTALKPALEATRVTPAQAQSRSQLESRAHRLVGKNALAGFAGLCGGFAIAFLSGKSIILGFTGLFFIIVGCAMISPALTVFFMGLLQSPLGRLFGVLGRLPPRSVSAALSRTGVAIAALMVAIATTIGMQIMVDSFRLSVADWLQDRLDADLYVYNPNSAASVSAHNLPETLSREIKGLSDVKAVSTVLRLQIHRPDDSLARVNVYELAPTTYSGFRFKSGTPDEIWPAFEQQDSVLVTEAYAYNHDLSTGSKLRLTTTRGEKAFPVVGIFKDYNAGEGIIAMSRKTHNKYWQKGGYSGIWVYANESADLNRLREAIPGLSSDDQLLRVTSNRAVIDESLKIFDQAFVITTVLRWLAACIAFAGVFSALMALQLDRIREFGILRAQGVTPRELWKLIIAETGLMGLIAGIIAAPVGYLTAVMLIFVINRRSFGWTMDLSLTPNVFVEGLLLAIVAAVLAGIYPALKMARTRPAEALRSE